MYINYDFDSGKNNSYRKSICALFSIFVCLFVCLFVLFS